MGSDAARPTGSPSTGVAAEAMPSSVAGRYRIERLLGKGGFGRVYLAQHVNTGEHVALKLLSEKLTEPEFIERFKREMRAPAQIRSGHVVRVLDADVAPELNGAPFFVMELLNGQDLHQRLRARGPLSSDGVVWVIGQIVKALARAHDLGLVHRDLKPENIYLHEPPDAPPMVKLLDFGLVHSVQAAPPPSADGLAGVAEPVAELERAPTLAQPSGPSLTPRLTAVGAMLGTPLYMAPEQIDAQRAPTGPATDVWALGLIAYELLVGQSYWPEASPMRVYANILAAQLVPPSQRSSTLPAAFDAWFARSCAALPSERWPNVNEQALALASALAVAPTWLQRLEPPWSSSGEPLVEGAVTASPGSRSAVSVDPGHRHRRRADDAATAKVSPPQRPAASPEANRRRWIFVVLLLLLVSGVAVLWRGIRRPAGQVEQLPAPASPPPAPAGGTTRPTPAPRPAEPALSAPERPPPPASSASGEAKPAHPRKRSHRDAGSRPPPRGEYVPAAP